VIEARPTVYNGIQMRSRLEADYAASLMARATSGSTSRPATGKGLPLSG
jgi:hypothetical protein